MDLDLEPEEPAVGSWRTATAQELWRDIRSAASTRRPPDAPLVVAIDGRSAAGKTTLAAALLELEPAAVLVHADDLAWNEPLFDWAHLLRDGVLAPFRSGCDVAFSPPAWIERGRPGAIEVPATTRVLLVEGVGSADASVADLLDATIWMQADRRLAEHRGIEQDVASGVDGDREQTVAFWATWGAAERRHLAEDRPWERADLVVAGTPPHPLPRGSFAVAPGPLRPAR